MCRYNRPTPVMFGVDTGATRPSIFVNNYLYFRNNNGARTWRAVSYNIRHKRGLAQASVLIGIALNQRLFARRATLVFPRHSS